MKTNLRDRLYTTEAIVLSRLDYGEADRILTVFTPGMGKLGIIAKGARRQKSRSGPQLDYFTRVTFHLARGRDLDVVTGAETIDAHGHLRDALVAYGHASYFAELVRTLTQEREENRRVYELLAKSLALLDEGIDPWPVARHFELVLLAALGYRPELYERVQCHQALEAVANAYSPIQGGVHCPRCRSTDPSALALSVNAQKYLRVLDRNGLAAAVRLRPSERERMEVEQTLKQHFRTIAERDFTSLAVLQHLLDLPAASPAQPDIAFPSA
jgi:DNA repair protein RecO (recombination protein O)